jgi:alcohol dehydrogenase class IV
MQALMHKLGIPVRLSSFGLGTEDINFMVNQYEPFRAAFERNPVEISKADFQEFIEGLV